MQRHNLIGDILAAAFFAAMLVVIALAIPAAIAICMIWWSIEIGIQAFKGVFHHAMPAMRSEQARRNRFLQPMPFSRN